jgi:protein-tyrosine phosphatase
MFEEIEPLENIDKKHKPSEPPRDPFRPSQTNQVRLPPNSVNKFSTNPLNKQNSYQLPTSSIPQDIQMMPKEFYEISSIILNLFLSGKHGEKYYDKFDVIINLNYPENGCPKGCLLVDKAKVYRLGIEDSHVEDLYTYFDLLSALLITSLKDNKKVLVQCQMGISRSVSIIMAFFIKYGNMSVQDALNKIKEKRSIVGPNQSSMKQLDFYSKKNKKN